MTPRFSCWQLINLLRDFRQYLAISFYRLRKWRRILSYSVPARFVLHRAASLLPRNDFGSVFQLQFCTRLEYITHR